MGRFMILERERERKLRVHGSLIDVHMVGTYWFEFFWTLSFKDRLPDVTLDFQNLMSRALLKIVKTKKTDWEESDAIATPSTGTNAIKIRFYARITFNNTILRY